MVDRSWGRPVRVWIASMVTLSGLVALVPRVAWGAGTGSPPPPVDPFVPWHLGALLVSITLVAGIIRRVAPAQRRRMRPSVILFVLDLLVIGVAIGLRALHLHEQADVACWIAGILETFITINLVTLFLFDVVLRALRVAPADILSDVLIGLAYLAAIIHGMHRAGVNFSGIVATSAVASGVLSLSLAPTIGNILGGLALQLDNSIHEGDWIQLDANTQGRVKTIHWRHTVVETRNWDTIIVPNATLLSANITILGKRTDQPVQRRYWVYFNVDFRYPPGEVIAVVNEALQCGPIPNVAADPKPHCICYDFARDGRDSFAYYAARYWLTDLAADDPTNSVMREHIFAALRRAGIPFALPATAVFLSQDNEEHAERKSLRERTKRIELLSKLELFKACTPEEIAGLADSLVYAPFARDEVMTRQGREAHWFYILAQGEAQVTFADEDGNRRHVGTLHGPDFFGEMAVLTGAPRSASVIATSSCECYRLNKDAFKKIMAERKELAQVVTDVLAARREGLQAVKDDDVARVEDARARLLETIETFFGWR